MIDGLGQGLLRDSLSDLFKLKGERMQDQGREAAKRLINEENAAMQGAVVSAVLDSLNGVGKGVMMTLWSTYIMSTESKKLKENLADHGITPQHKFILLSDFLVLGNVYNQSWSDCLAAVETAFEPPKEAPICE